MGGIADLHVLLDGSLEGRRVGTNNGSDLLSVLEEHESGHGADAQLLGDLGKLVDVNLVEASAGVCGGHPVEGRAISRRTISGWNWRRLT
jgi:hypothetical protein